MFLLVDYGKVLCSSANELQQNSDAFSKEEYIPGILTVFIMLYSSRLRTRLHLTFEAFCFSFCQSKTLGKTI